MRGVSFLTPLLFVKALAVRVKFTHTLFGTAVCKLKYRIPSLSNDEGDGIFSKKIS